MTRRCDSSQSTNVLTAPAQFAVTAKRSSAGLVRVVVTGEIDAGTLDRLDRELSDQPRVGTTALVVDVSGVLFCSISGGRSLVGLLDRSTMAGVPLALVDAHAIRRVLKFIPGAELLSSHRDLPSALAAVGGP